MSSAPRSAVARWFEWTLRQSICFWPHESREWGRAVAAEASEIDCPLEAARWAFGGVLFFLRSLGAHFLAWTRLPAGANYPSFLTGGEPPLLPKHSRLTTALLLIGAIMLLLFPWGREAVSGVRGIWWTVAADSGDVKSLAERAEREHDARKLAFAAISHPEPTSGIELAGKAVSLDPSLAWIYASRFYRPELGNLPAHWLTDLEAYDPDNGYVYLLAANHKAQPLFAALVDKHSPSESEIDKTLASNPEWLGLMQRAVRAPRYESYSNVHRDLTREIWSSETSLSPAVVTYSLWATQIPDSLFVKSYMKLRIHQAQEIQARGDWQQAEQSLNELHAFGTRMAATNQTFFEQQVGLEVSRYTLIELKSLYSASHREQEAQSAAQQLEELNQRRAAQLHWDREKYAALFASYRRSASIVQFCVALLLFSAMAATASLVFLEISALRPSARNRFASRLACWLADYAPVLFALASLALLVSFRPFAAAFAQFRSGVGPLADARFFDGVYFSLLTVLPRGPVAGYDNSYYRWWAATVALAAIALLIALRGISRRNSSFTQK